MTGRRSLSVVLARGLPTMLLAALTLLLWLSVAPARADVSEQGSFTTSVSVEVPPFRGMEPSISLSYDSTLGNGVVGVGWRLDAVSSITRAGRFGGPPRNGSDVFLLDGVELIPCAPSCLSEGTHETRQRDFSRIAMDQQGGWTHWTRWLPGGVKLEYAPIGLGYPGAPGQRWALQRATDTHGNSVEYQHACDGKDCYLESIRYADEARWCMPENPNICVAGPIGARVRFLYEARPDPVSYGAGSDLIITSKRLKAITVSMGGKLRGAYALRYEASGSTASSLLRAIQRFPSDATVSDTGEITAGPTPPDPPTELSTASLSSGPGAWSTSTVPMGERLSLGADPPGHPTHPPVFGERTVDNPAAPIGAKDGPERFGTAHGDFDGDRRTDWLAWGLRGHPCDEIVFRTLLAGRPSAGPIDSSGPQWPSDWEGAGCVSDSVLTADFDGDGLDDVLLADRGGGLTLATSRGDGRFSLGEFPRFPSEPGGEGCATGDLDADQRTDLACVYDEGTLTYLATVRFRDGGPVVRRVPLGLLGAQDARRTKLGLADVNADGRADAVLAIERKDCGAACVRWQIAVGHGDGAGEVHSWWGGTDLNWRFADWPDGSWPGLFDRSDWQLSTGDFDGDGRADVALASPSGDVRVATSPKGANTRLLSRGSVQVPRHAHQDGSSSSVIVGDVDGDGRSDLLSTSPAGRAIANIDGSFSAWSKTASMGSCLETFGEPADVNGDGRTDLLCTTGVDATGDPSTQLTVHERISPNDTADDARWLPADVNGDGRQDLVYVHPRNPGYEVITLMAARTGEYARTATTIEPRADLPASNADLHGWLVMDVGGGADGRADGRNDLVLVERRRVVSLMSTAAGWTAVSQATPFDSSDRTWRPAALDHDGRTDLVHFSSQLTAEGARAGVRVEYLRSRGDGTWTAGERVHFDKRRLALPHLIEPLAVPDVRNFRTLDLNGDRLTDFTYVEPGSQTRVRTLTANGDGTWEERVDHLLHATTPAEALRFEPAEFNGDGLADLVFIEPPSIPTPSPFDLDDAEGCLQVTAFVSTGYRWQIEEAPTAAPPACRATAGVGDTDNFRLLDVNGDNRSDIVHLSVVGGDTGPPRTAVHLLLNRPGRAWSPVDKVLAFDVRDTWSYRSLDVDHDGRGELVRPGADLAVVGWDSGDDRLVEIENGRGATTTVAYRSLAEGRRYLPAGALPPVVESVTVTDHAHVRAVAETATWTYEGGLWSDEQGQLLGFAEVTTAEHGGIQKVAYELTEECGSRISGASTLTTEEAVLASTTTTFVPAGAQAPFTCLAERVLEQECEGQPTCATKTATLAHDAFGNLTSNHEAGARAGQRLTTFDFRPNVEDYIVNKPARRQLYQANAARRHEPVWRRAATTEYLYDTNTAWDAPPGRLGELRQTRAWDDRTDTFAESTFEYDARGNTIKTTDPVGVVETTGYDTQRSLFPEKHCTPVGCTEQTWNVTLGVVRTTTDLNGRVVTHHHDAHGRETLVERPDGSTTRTSYLDEASWTGPPSQRRRIRTELSDGSPDDGVLWREQLLDGLDRTYMTIDEGDGQGDILTEVKYADASTRPAATASPHLAGRPAVWTTHSYDAADRPTRTSFPDGSFSETRYEAPGETLTRDPVGRTRVHHEDEFGRIIRVDELAKTRTASGTTRYIYNALDLPEHVTDASGNFTRTTWDSLGRKVAEDDPDRGSRSWTWRADGTPDTATDAQNQTIEWGYDQAGRPTSRRERAPDGTVRRTVKWHWDRGPATGKPHGHSIGAIVRSEYTSPVASGETNEWYDALGRVTRSLRCVESSCVEMGFSFDAAGRLGTHTYPDDEGALSAASERIEHAYDRAGRLASLTRTGDGTRIVVMGYNSLGQLERLEHANGIVERFDYDPRRHWIDAHTIGRLASEGIERPRPSIFRANYEHHSDGKLATAVEHNPARLDQQLDYDDHGRLVTVTASDHSRDRAYQYDPIGRITWSAADGLYAYDDPAHIHATTGTASGHERDYDPNGNLIALHDPPAQRSAGSSAGPARDLAIEWTIAGLVERIDVDRSSRADTVLLAYDASDDLVVKHNRSGMTRFFGPYVEQSTQGEFVRNYWAGDRLVARRTKAGLTALHQDRMRSTRVVTNATGQVTTRFEYDPFGEPLTPVSGDERLWQGHRRHHESGLVHLGARFYDPILGQFISADSIIPNLYRPQSLNRYAYVENDPANYIDPSGHAGTYVESSEKLDMGSGFNMSRGRGDWSENCGVFAQGCLRHSAQVLMAEMYVPEPAELEPLAELVLEQPLALAEPAAEPLLCAACSLLRSSIDVDESDPPGSSYDSVVIVTRDFSVGSHAALYLENAGSPVLFDPGGTYLRGSEWDPGSSAIFLDEPASLSDYVKYQQSTGSTVELYRFATSVSEQREILERILPSDGSNGIGEGGFLTCAVRVCDAIKGIGPFKTVDSYTPGALATQLNELLYPLQRRRTFSAFMLERLTD